MAILQNIDPGGFNFKMLVAEVLNILTNKTAATELRAILYGDLYPNGVLKLDQTPLMPGNDPSQDNHAARKRYVDKMNRRSFFFGVLNE